MTPTRSRLEVSDTLINKPSNSYETRQDRSGFLPPEPRKYWEVSTHCESLLLPQLRADMVFDNPSTNYHYKQLATSSAPSLHMGRLITHAHGHTLRRLNLSLLQGLCNIVLEQAQLKFQDLCRLLVAIASNSKVKSLFLWHVLDSCDKPFEGPLQSDNVLDDLPRIPYTYNPGGRKYLRDLKESAEHRPQKEYSQNSKEAGSEGVLHKIPTIKSCTSQTIPSDTSWKSYDNISANADSKVLVSELGKLEDMVIKCLTISPSGDMACKMIKKELAHVKVSEEEHVFSQADVGIQCALSQEFEEIGVTRDTSHTNHQHAEDSKRNTQTDIKTQYVKSARLGYCKKYLKHYEHTKINFDVLGNIYKIALNALTQLTQLAVNYCMLADGTGNALLSIGSISKGKLRHLKLLCEPQDVPSPTHQLYEDRALHAIPDLIWRTVLKDCPDLKVHIVCVSMSVYEVTKRFVTKSMPLSSFFMENGFCPTEVAPQLTIYCTLKCLWLDHAETLENVNLTLWHSTGKIDSSLEKLIEKTHLHSFAYYGPLQYKTTVDKLCDAALASSRMKNFKLMIQGDPCFPHIAQEYSSNMYNEYQQSFREKSIHFELGTFSS